MHTPGFTADASLKKTIAFYVSGAQVTPFANFDAVSPQQTSCPAWICSALTGTCNGPLGSFFGGEFCSYLEFFCELACGIDFSGPVFPGYTCYENCVQAGGDPEACATSCGYQPAQAECCVWTFNKKTGKSTCKTYCKPNQHQP
jgi:hypothetical protein